MHSVFNKVNINLKKIFCDKYIKTDWVEYKDKSIIIAFFLSEIKK